jgi:hypothetical protein
MAGQQQTPAGDKAAYLQIVTDSQIFAAKP